jgi:hypothetical protein
MPHHQEFPMSDTSSFVIVGAGLADRYDRGEK